MGVKTKPPGSFVGTGWGGGRVGFTGYSFSCISQSAPAHIKAIAGQPKMGGRKVSMAMVSMVTANRMSSAMMIFMGGIWVLNIIPPRRRED